ncbi:hypothetical protein KO465_01090 [Candidatus Micrarchaeota archaeon]|nr:hypothetical protein [Candidatus Micrarchaeota archaeon]
MARKGQAAMEYLMTYGWALLIIIVVMAIFIGLILNIQTPRACDFSTAGFICHDPMPAIMGSDLKGRLGNGPHQQVTIHAIACTDDRGSDSSILGVDPCSAAPLITMSQGQYKSFDEISGGSLTCPNADTVTVGGTYTGKVWIAYTLQGDDQVGIDCRYANAVIAVEKSG